MANFKAYVLQNFHQNTMHVSTAQNVNGIGSPNIKRAARAGGFGAEGIQWCFRYRHLRLLRPGCQFACAVPYN